MENELNYSLWYLWHDRLKTFVTKLCVNHVKSNSKTKLARSSPSKAPIASSFAISFLYIQNKMTKNKNKN